MSHEKGPPPEQRIRDAESRHVGNRDMTPAVGERGGPGRYRRAFVEREGRLPGPAEVLTSQLRAGGFWVRKRAVHHADRHPLAARASRLYVQRTSPTSRW